MAPFKKTGGFRSGGDRPGGFRPGGGGDRPQFARKGNFSHGRDERGGDRDSRPVQMFNATCAECRKACEVPFRPNGEKPVFCRDCFASKRGTEGERGERSDRSAAPTRDFTPRDYDRPTAPPTRPQTDPRIDDLKRQMDTMTKKLDILTQMIEGLGVSGSPAVPVKNEESLTAVVKKVAKKAAPKAKKVTK